MMMVEVRRTGRWAEIVLTTKDGETICYMDKKSPSGVAKALRKDIKDYLSGNGDPYYDDYERDDVETFLNMITEAIKKGVGKMKKAITLWFPEIDHSAMAISEDGGYTSIELTLYDGTILAYDGNERWQDLAKELVLEISASLSDDGDEYYDEYTPDELLTYKLVLEKVLEEEEEE